MYSPDDDYYSNCMGTYYCHPSAVEAPEEVDAVADAEGTEDTKTLQATTATEVADVVEATAVPATLQDDKVVEMSEGDFVGGSQIPQPALHREVRTRPRTWMPSGPVRIFGAHAPYPLPCSSQLGSNLVRS